MLLIGIVILSCILLQKRVSADDRTFMFTSADSVRRFPESRLKPFPESRGQRVEEVRNMDSVCLDNGIEISPVIDRFAPDNAQVKGFVKALYSLSEGLLKA